MIFRIAYPIYKDLFEKYYTSGNFLSAYFLTKIMKFLPGSIRIIARKNEIMLKLAKGANKKELLQEIKKVLQEIPKKEEYVRERIELIILLSYIYHLLGKYSEAIKSIEGAIRLCKLYSLENLLVRAKIIRYHFLAHISPLGILKEMEKFVEEVDTKDYSNIIKGNAWLVLGDSYIKSGIVENCLHAINNAEKYYAKTKNGKYLVGICYAKNYKSIFYLYKDNPAKAKKYIIESIDLNINGGVISSECLCESYSILSQIFEKLGDYEKAMFYIRHALALSYREYLEYVKPILLYYMIKLCRISNERVKNYERIVDYIKTIAEKMNLKYILKMLELERNLYKISERNVTDISKALHKLKVEMQYSEERDYSREIKFIEQILRDIKTCKPIEEIKNRDYLFVISF